MLLLLLLLLLITLLLLPVLLQVWPVLDPVVCQLIRSTIEPLLDDMKPPFIAAMGFQKLTLGELPVELEGIRVIGGDKQGEQFALTFVRMCWCAETIRQCSQPRIVMTNWGSHGLPEADARGAASGAGRHQGDGR
jgi:hypothetical protein